jgi:hypothetical protein
MHRLLIVAAILLLASCAPWSLVGPGRTQVAGGKLSVEPGIAWNKRANIGAVGGSDVELWTQHGPVLDQLVFYGGVAPGEPLFQGPKKDEYPKFQSGMSAIDVMDLYQSSLVKALDARALKPHGLAPARFAGLDGFQFRLGYALKDDVDRELNAIGAIRDGKLYMIAWIGTRLYHYQKSLAEFERIAASAQIAG